MTNNNVYGHELPTTLKIITFLTDKFPQKMTFTHVETQQRVR